MTGLPSDPDMNLADDDDADQALVLDLLLGK